MEKKKVMIVDDDAEFLKELNETVMFSGYECVSYDDGSTALKMIEDTNPDVILLDLRMRGKSGFHIAGELKNSPKTKNIPVIAMTGFYKADEHTPLMNLCGVRTCLQKPFYVLEMIMEIESAVKKNNNIMYHRGNSYF